VRRGCCFPNQLPPNACGTNALPAPSSFSLPGDGKTWNPVSNQRDPHLLADPSAGATLFGYQWGNNAWFKSTNGGVTFATGFIATTGNGSRSVNQLAVPNKLGNVLGAGFQSGPVTAESIVTALGFDLAAVSLPNTANLVPANLGGTTVTVVDSTGTSRLAPLFYRSWMNGDAANTRCCRRIFYTGFYNQFGPVFKKRRRDLVPRKGRAGGGHAKTTQHQSDRDSGTGVSDRRFGGCQWNTNAGCQYAAKPGYRDNDRLGRRPGF
jgi:hypothetical protein